MKIKIFNIVVFIFFISFTATESFSTCYIAFDNNNNKIYDGHTAPIDLSFPEPAESYKNFMKAGGKLIIAPDQMCQGDEYVKNKQAQLEWARVYVGSGQYESDQEMAYKRLAEEMESENRAQAIADAYAHDRAVERSLDRIADEATRLRHAQERASYILNRALFPR